MYQDNPVFFIFLYFFVQGSYAQDFGYDGEEGPNHWGTKYSECVGKHQSPIDIDIHSVIRVNFPKLKFEHFDKRLETVAIENNGHTVKLSVKHGHLPRISGGPLNGTYEFVQLHFHWGDNDTIGSENMVNHNSFPLELHMLFYKKFYKTLDEATTHPDGLVVLSFLYSATEKENKQYSLLERGLKNITNVNTKTELSNFVSLDKFTMKKKDVYFTYEGSLTTPPCSEVVTWIEFHHTIPLAHNQIEAFRQLDGTTGKLRHNYRPTQNINDRMIRMNSSNLINGQSILIVLCILIIYSRYKVIL